MLKTQRICRSSHTSDSVKEEIVGEDFFGYLENGITLVSLIVTIILLLILAGVSINIALGENGIFSNSKKATERYIKAQLKEEIELAITDIQIEQLKQGKNTTLEVLKNELPNKLNILTQINENKIVGEYKKYNYEIDNNNNYNVIIGDKIEGISFEYVLQPEDYTKESIKIKIIATSSNGKITNIQSPEGVEKNEDGTYTVTENGNYEFIVEDSTGKSVTKTITIGKIDKIAPISATIVIEESTITKKGFTITVTAQDEQSGIGRYEYYIKSNEQTEYKKYESTENRYTVDNLEQGTEYTIYVIAYDKANNPKQSNFITCETFSDVMKYAILTSKGIMNCIDDNGNYYFDETVNPKAEDAILYEAYDGKSDTCDLFNTTKYLKIDSSAEGLDINVDWWDNSSFVTYTINILNEDKSQVLYTKTQQNLSRTQDIITIKENMRWLQITTNPFNSYNGVIYEIGTNIGNPEIIIQEQSKYLETQRQYPVITSNGVEKIECGPNCSNIAKIAISYPKAADTKMYKINEGEWKEYTGEFQASIGDTIYAKTTWGSSIKENQWKINELELIDESNLIGEAAYDKGEGYEGTFYLGGNTTTKYMEVLPTAWGKTFYVKARGYQYITFSDANGKPLYSGDTRATESFITIPEGTVILVYYFNENAGIYHMSVLD